ncbi:hypothetical protein AWH48_11925 [Domibacillus aminovorans]|uniref:Peptidase M15C domain-containing protein n=1 Tax=Domibacillus aminovorans TaxID=29332 RepID=A0A177KI39_9BACI|nr:peptidoglycan-binding protein [Domibacillus aminovorans]OAH53060.1 hypothetical protein AWH48_11925 [Domibacillus aminovorans]
MNWTPTYHQRNLGNLEDLAPNTEAAAREWYQWCIDNKIDILIYETIRSVAQQKKNVASGASQTMKSYHLVGQALDFVPLADGKAQWAKSEYAKRPILTAIEQAEKLKFESGYRWGWDAPHLQYNYKGYGTDKILTTAASAAPVASMTKVEILDLQEKLTALGLDTNGIDGIYGKGTANAILILQRRKNLVMDGIAGKTTLAMIDKLLAEKELIGTPGIFRVVTGVFGSVESAEAAAKTLGFNARKGANDNRVYTGVFRSLESAQDAWEKLRDQHKLHFFIKKY